MPMNTFHVLSSWRQVVWPRWWCKKMPIAVQTTGLVNWKRKMPKCLMVFKRMPSFQYKFSYQFKKVLRLPLKWDILPVLPRELLNSCHYLSKVCSMQVHNCSTLSSGLKQIRDLECIQRKWIHASFRRRRPSKLSKTHSYHYVIHWLSWFLVCLPSTLPQLCHIVT